LSYAGVVSGAGGLSKLGAGTLTLSGANTYTGSTAINEGTLFVTNGSAISDSSAVTIATGAALALGSNETIASLAGSGTLSLGGSQLIAGGSGASTVFSGIASGNGSIVKQGSGTMSLSGANTFTGGLFIDNGAADLAGGSMAAGVIEIGGGTSGGLQPGNDAKLTVSTNATFSRNITVNSETNNVGVTGLRTIEFANPSATVATLSGSLSLEKQLFVSANSGVTGVFSGAISGSGNMVKQGAGTVALSGASTASGGLYIDNGTINLNGGSIAFGGIDIGGGVNGSSQPGNSATLRVSAGSFTQSLTVNAETNSSGVSGSRFIEFANASGTSALSGSIAVEKTVSVSTAGAQGVLSGVISGAGGLTKTGGGTLTLSGAGANTFSGTTTVSGGVLELAKSVSNAVNGNLVVGSGTTDSSVKLLLSTSDQVGSSSGQTVTLSGGTIARGGNVSEVFGNLNLTAASFLDYGASNDVGTLRFGTYAPSALLTVQNFLPGNKLQFGNTISSTDLNNASLFAFSSNFTTGTESGFFTITAIPEPSTYVAAAALLAVLMWPSRRRLVKDAKSILGLRAPARDRLVG
jgi:hypothetical protein